MSSSPGQCPSCHAELQTPVACGQCGALVDLRDRDLTGENAVSPFDVLGMDMSFAVDVKDARKKLRRIAHKVHPDFYATAGEEQLAIAEHNNALLNQAYSIIENDALRADWIVRYLGGPGEKDLGCMSQHFLMEVMEWNEVLDENEPGSSAFTELEEELRKERSELMEGIEALLSPLPEHGADALKDVRKSLNGLRYIERALHRIAGLPAQI